MIESGHGYTNSGYGHFEQRPWLIEQIALERITWCSRGHCPGCRGNHVNDHLFAGSEVWTTTRGPEPLHTIRRDEEVVAMYTKPTGRVTVRVSHPAGNRRDAIRAVREWVREVDSEDRKRLAIWIAADGCSWRGPGERTAVLYQPTDLPGPAGWTTP